ncbi:MAG: hypothetical protein HUJ94_06035 [Bacteroidales bacterium]|nr:hypothetical protein [Bacteroidales bacterium]
MKMRVIKTIIAAAALLGTLSCEKVKPEPPDLPVTYANIDGIWRLDRWKGSPLAEGTSVFSIADAGNGKFAMTMKSGLSWNIALGNIGRDFKNNTFEKISFPENRMTMRYVSYSESDNSIYFSWTKPDAMPRLGKYSLDDSSFYFADNNISGGVYYPVRFGDSSIFYIGQFRKQNRIFSIDNPDKNFVQKSTVVFASPKETLYSEVAPDVITLQKPAEETLFDAKKYNPLKYYLKPNIIPLSVFTSPVFDLRSEYVGQYAAYLLGFTLVGANPWSTGSAQFSFGCDLFTKCFGANVVFTDTTDTSLFKYTVAAQTEFDSLGFKNALLQAQESLNFDLISISDTSTFIAGRSTYQPYLLAEADENTLDFQNDNLLYLDNQLIVAFGFVRHDRAELMNYLGFETSVVLTNVFEKSLTGTEFSYNSFNVGAEIAVALPNLLPIDCADRFVYNLPFSASVSAYTDTTYVFSGKAQTTLFGYDIQKGIPILFFDKIYLDLGYSCGFAYSDSQLAKNLEVANIGNHISAISRNELPFADKIYADLNFQLTPGIGQIFASFDFVFELYYKFRMLPDDPATNPFNCSFWIEASL